MQDPHRQERFGGIARLYGVAAAERLAVAHVAVVGVGGVGSWTVEALARSGIGALTLIDMDDVCITNTNRQLPALRDTVGQPKVAVLAERVRLISPGCEVTAVTEFFLESNADRLLAPAFDMVVDAVDRMSIKALLLARCRQRGLRVITSGAAGGRRDGTRVRVADLGLTGRDPLLAQVRRELRRRYGFPGGQNGRAMPLGIPAVYSDEPPWYPQADGSCAHDPEADAGPGLRLDCAAGFGAATPVTGAFGFALAGAVVTTLTEG